MSLSLEPKIIIYDSGVGGKSIFLKCKKLFKNTHFFCDIDNFPYGNKTFQELKNIFLKNLALLNLEKNDLLVLACNTISSVYIQIKNDLHYKNDFITILDFVLDLDDLVICTSYTSKFLNNIKKINKALPELAYFIQYRQHYKIEKYLINEIIDSNKVIYGCTHFPIVDNIFKTVYPEKIFINPENSMIEKVIRWIVSH